MEILFRIIALTRKELITLLVNKKSRLVLILPPIAQIMVFGYAANFELNQVPVAVYNQDRGSYSRELLAHFDSGTFRLVRNLTSSEEIAPVIENKQALIVVQFGPDFSSDILSGREATLQLIVDGRNSNVALIALNYVQQIVSGFNRELAIQHRRINGGDQGTVLVVRSWFNEMLDSHWFIIPGIVALLTIVITLEVTALSVAKEREAGTFDQLLVSPYSPFEILAGKSIPAILIGLIEATLVILIVVFWFNIPLRGSIFTLYAGLFIFILSAVGIGLMISSISVTQQQGLMGAFFFLVPAVILSGFATPISNMPELVQDLTLLNPMRYVLVIVRGVFLKGAGFDLLWSQFVPMLAIGIVTLVMAALLFRKRMG